MTTRWYLDDLDGYSNLLIAVVDSWRRAAPRATKRAWRIIHRWGAGHLTAYDLVDVCFPMRSSVIVSSIAVRVGLSPDEVCKRLVDTLPADVKASRDQLLAYISDPAVLSLLSEPAKQMVEEAYRQCGS